MIGVVSENSEESVIREFFELFKTPWEFARSGRRYDVALITVGDAEAPEAPVVICFGSGRKSLDDRYGIRLKECLPPSMAIRHDRLFPLFQNCAVLEGPGSTVLELMGSRETAGLKFEQGDRTFYRFGYDLFREIDFLLRSGQPPEHALTPTLDIHMDLLRESIVSAGIPLVEIPPVPAAHPFIACLTHDVDFVGIRRHKLDPTMVGFIYRALFDSLLRTIKGSLPWHKMLRNWKAVASLPGIYLGIAEDFMVQFDRYAEIEQGLPSTFFFIPQKNKAGLEPEGRSSRGRAVKYDMADIPNEIHKLRSRGCEIGLHGIDAWYSPERADEERRRVSQVTGKPDVGVRMHWLFFTEETPRVLEQAGFSYDSTCGYNDAVGYKAGTSQAFRPPGTGLFELPLLIQDTTLFTKGRMGLSESAALERVRDICSHAYENGGVVTINWHHRSVGPERFWDDFYIRLLEELKNSGAWFTTARGAVAWFGKRRSIVFKNVESDGNKMLVRLVCPSGHDGPGVLLRVHHPPPMAVQTSTGGGFARREDFPVNGDYEAVIPLSE